jgi:hypothetical protein
MIPQKPEWNWDEVIATMINFWLKHEDSIKHWQLELKNAGKENLIVARVANFDVLRTELQNLLDN